MSERLTKDELDDIQKAADDPMAGELIYVYKEFLRKLIAAARAQAASGLTLTDEYRQSHPHEYAAAAHDELNEAWQENKSLTAENARLKEQLNELS